MEPKINIDDVYKIVGRVYMELQTVTKNAEGQIKALQQQLSEEVQKRLLLERQLKNDESGQRETSK